MRDSEPKTKRRGRRAGRALLVLLCLLCVAGSAYLGYRGVTELAERRRGSAFYTQLAQTVAGGGDEPARGAATPHEGEPEHTEERAAAAAGGEAAETDGEGSTAAPDGAAAGQRTARPAKRPADGEEAADAQGTASTTLAATPAPAASDEPAPTATPRRSEMDFDTLWQTCPDVVGWIRLADSVIDYPVVQGEDNDFYLHHLADGTPNQAGSIMMDQANHGDFSDTVTILHGHHMRSGAMFGDLDEYKKEAYYRQHPSFRLYTPGGDYEVAVFAAYTVNGYTFGYPTSFADEAAFDAFIRRAISATPYETGVEVSYGDRLVLLSTCAYTYQGARYIVIGKIQEEEPTGAAQLMDTARPKGSVSGE